MKKVTDSYTFLQGKRYQRWLKNQEKAQPLVNNASVVNKEAHLEHFRTISRRSLPSKKIPRWTPASRPPKQRLELKIPEDFSLLGNPEDVLDIISQLSHMGEDRQVVSVHIDHSKMLEDDLAAEILLGQTVAYIEASRKKKGGKFHVSGTYPQDREKIRLLNSVGVVKELNAKNDHEDSDVEKVQIFKRHGLLHEELNIHVGDQKSRAITGFTDYLNSCLATIGKVLTEKGEQRLGEYVGEIIGNAEEYSGTGYWHIYGYVDGTNPEKIYAEVVIYGLGQSIYDSFDGKRNNHEVYNRIEPYVSAHSHLCSERLLTTVAALQQFVSTKIDEDPTRGQGTIDLLEFFNTISRECIEGLSENKISKLKLITGGVSIDVDGTYLPQQDANGRSTIYFNDLNVESMPPNEKYVKELNGVSFPGTLITIKFPLRDDSLIKESGDDNV
ncbi:hypothetical protein [Pseudoteredinibacter isoporae]|uniref:hypothetical protein n=1 Tax=Pseudoteredinibacter isoporae TaxID=570281 RepID=UPI003105BB54